MEKILTDDTFAVEIEKGLPLIIDFSAAWCGPCRAVAPLISELAEEYNGRITVAKVDVDDCPQAALEFGVMSIPTIVFIKDKQLVDKVIGAVPKSELVKRAEALLQD